MSAVLRMKQPFRGGQDGKGFPGQGKYLNKCLRGLREGCSGVALGAGAGCGVSAERWGEKALCSLAGWRGGLGLVVSLLTAIVSSPV